MDRPPPAPTPGAAALAASLALVAPGPGCAAPKAPSAVPEGPRVEIAGGGLRVEDAGAGPAVVFLPGEGLDLRVWEAQTALAAEGWRVVRVDLRGWGASDPPRAPFANATDLALLLDSLGIERAVVVGHSVGGGIALDFALRHPGRVRALVLVSTVVGGWTPSEAYRDRIERIGAAGLEGGPEAWAQAWLADPHYAPGLHDILERTRVARLLAENWDRPHPDVLRFVRRLDPPALERLHEVEAPTLVVSGELDDVDTRAIAARVAGEAPNARAVEIAGAGHLVPLERPEEFTEGLERFLASLGPTAE